MYIGSITQERARASVTALGTETAMRGKKPIHHVHTSKCSVGSDDSNFQSCLNCVIYSLLCVNFVLRHICIRITNS